MVRGTDDVRPIEAVRKYEDIWTEEWGTIMQKQCAHPKCTCLAPAGKEFCSDQCRNADPPTGQCKCTHPDCKGH